MAATRQKPDYSKRYYILFFRASYPGSAGAHSSIRIRSRSLESLEESLNTCITSWAYVRRNIDFSYGRILWGSGLWSATLREYPKGNIMLDYSWNTNTKRVKLNGFKK